MMTKIMLQRSSSTPPYTTYVMMTKIMLQRSSSTPPLSLYRPLSLTHWLAVKPSVGILLYLSLR